MIHSPETKVSVERSTHAGTLLGAFSLLAVTTATYLEANATVKNRRGRTDQAAVVSNIRPGEFANFTVPGFHSDGRVIGANLDRHLESLGTTHYAVHPESGFSLDSIKEKWLKARAEDGHRPARIYAMSMGGLLVSKLFSDESFRKEFGEVDTLVLDSALSKTSDLSHPVRAAMHASKLLPPTNMTGKFYNYAMSREAKKPIPHGEEVNSDEALAHYISSGKTPYGAGIRQIGFIEKTSVLNTATDAFGKAIRNKRYISSSKDNVLDVFAASKTYNDSYGGGMTHYIESRRSHGGHAEGAEFPSGIVDMLSGENLSRYRIISIGNSTIKTALDSQPE